jgi:nucleotide-binding universal stress UspA family protein
MGVDRAVELAREHHAEITLLHVIETVEHISFDEMKQFYERLEKSAREGLKECSERYADSGLKISEIVVYGHRSKEIVNYAIENRIDLIVVASHRIDPDRPGHDWSTISYAVAILAPCPVLLVK